MTRINPAFSAAINEARVLQLNEATARATKAETELARRDFAARKAAEAKRKADERDAREREASKKRRAARYAQIEKITNDAFAANGSMIVLIAQIAAVAAKANLSADEAMEVVANAAKASGVDLDSKLMAEQVINAGKKCRVPATDKPGLKGDKTDDPDAPEDDNSDVGDHVPDDPKKKKSKKTGKSDDDKRDDDSVKSDANTILSNWLERAAQKDQEQKAKCKVIADLVVAAGDKRRGR
ncbi:MAG: hypothetical protein AB1508_12690 [Pseudomonadota bacterium]